MAYDEGAASTAFRTMRIPDTDRKWLSLGAGWQATSTTKFDISYAHLFISDTEDIDDNQTAAVPLGKSRVSGDYDSSVDILSMQVTHNF